MIQTKKGTVDDFMVQEPRKLRWKCAVPKILPRVYIFTIAVKVTGDPEVQIIGEVATGGVTTAAAEICGGKGKMCVDK